jgi:uncharacterized protein
MLITAYQDPDDFLVKTRATLAKDEVTNGLLLGIVSSIKKSSLYETYYLATIEDENGLLVAACMTPPHNLLLYSREPENAAAFTLLIQELLGESWSVPGVTGPVPVAEKFAQTWTQLTGQLNRVRGHTRVFVLDQVIFPVATQGALRIARENELDLIVEWTAAFWQEIFHKDDPDGSRRNVEMKMRAGDIYVWETPDKRVVSMVAKTRPLTDVITVAMVYTPPEYRGMGYASNCVATFSQLLLDEGWKHCSLFTDLANPISNSIYQKMGYKPVCDFNEYVFGS